MELNMRLRVLLRIELHFSKDLLINIFKLILRLRSKILETSFKRFFNNVL